MTRPLDIVLLVLDTQRADRLSCCGCPVETSPCLDALAAESTLLAHAVAPAQWTIPAHASMFTGLYPSQHAMLQMDSALPGNLPTLAERLRQAGYFTAGFSNNPMVGVLRNGLSRGFECFSNYGGLLALPLQTGARASGFGMPLQRFRRWLSGLLRRAQNTAAHCGALNRFLSSPAILPLWRAALRLRGNLKGNSPLALADAARLLIGRQGTAPDQPIFVFINLMGAHMPYAPPRWALEHYAPRVLRDPAAGAFTRRINMTCLNDWQGDALLTVEQKATLDGLYNAEVAAQDAQLGIFFQCLRAARALDHTLLMVTADHGEHLGEKQMLGHAWGVYEELIRVPLLIHDPLGDLPRGARLDHFVSTRRLFHTALTAAGAATPDEERLTVAQADDPCDPDRDFTFAEAEPLHAVVRSMQRRRPDLLRGFDYDQPCRAIYHGDYKLIATDHHIQLYAVRRDPAENQDVGSILSEQAEALYTQLQAWRQMRSAAAETTHLPAAEAALVLQRLRDLGYLE